MSANRGPRPKDAALFAAQKLPTLRSATDDLGYLLERGYNAGSALTLVGNRYRLAARQRLAVGRCAAATSSVRQRQSCLLTPPDLKGRPIAIDGFNLLITLESAAGGAVVLRGRDGALRDLSSVHGTYKRVRQTLDLLASVGTALLHAGPVTWYFDRPVSNSGRLKTIIRQLGTEHGFDWTAELAYNPDRVLMGLPPGHVRITSDSLILDTGHPWCNLAACLIDARATNLVEL